MKTHTDTQTNVLRHTNKQKRNKKKKKQKKKKEKPDIQGASLKYKSWGNTI